MPIWIVKIGSSLITRNTNNLSAVFIKNLTQQIVTIKNNNINIILVSSGAIPGGMHAINMAKRPKKMHKLQALASIGQMDLVHLYKKYFLQHNTIASQILLTNDNLTNKNRRDNILGTMYTLFHWGVIPIVNENDSVATDEIKFGDNDNLAALLSNAINANKLIMLTDQVGLCDKNPKKHNDAKLIDAISKNDKNLDTIATNETNVVGTGGMLSKVMAAKITKCEVHIANGINKTTLLDIFSNKAVGTILY